MLVRELQRVCKVNDGYINLALSFDIETTSSYNKKGEKIAFMYVWALALENRVVYGRTWEEFISLIEDLSEYYETGKKRKLVVYVHNLSYEFQFMRKWFNWIDLFALDERQVLYALTDNYIEFRCSYLYSNMSLRKLAESAGLSVQKEEMDYKLIRTHETELTFEEISYLEKDVLIVTEYIRNEMNKYGGNLSELQRTNTGKVRDYCRKKCLESEEYFKTIKSLTLTLEEYQNLQSAFQGGFTHSSTFYTGDLLHDVHSMDFSSAYISALCCCYFPMKRGYKIKDFDKDDFEYYLKNKCCLFKVRIKGLKNKIGYESYLSYSKCYIPDEENLVVNNGRIYECEELYTTLTELDWEIVKEVYDFDSFAVADLYIYERGYLPKELIECALNLYKDKTELKGVEGKEEEYLNKKEMLNSIYGMCCTDITREDVKYENEEWSSEQGELENKVAKNNINKNRFLFYPWAIWITAHNRYNLWFGGILPVGEDYVYSDTDSVKYLGEHDEIFKKYNENIDEKIKEVCEYYNLSEDLFRPKTKEGKEKVLGYWDFDGDYSKFKTLGAKRYMYENKKGISITIAGLSKSAVNYIKENGGFDFFEDGMFIPSKETGKNTHTYIDEEIEEKVVDYKGQESEVYEKSFIHLEEAEFSLGIEEEFKNFIKNMKTYRIMIGN